MIEYCDKMIGEGPPSEYNVRQLLCYAYSTLDFLLEQQGRQIDMEEASCSYPSRFPEWDKAWERARAAMCMIEEHLLEEM